MFQIPFLNLSLFFFFSHLHYEEFHLKHQLLQVVSPVNISVQATSDDAQYLFVSLMQLQRFSVLFFQFFLRFAEKGCHFVKKFM